MTLRIILACLALLSAPYWALYAQAASGGSLPEWAQRFDGFRLAEIALSDVETTGNGNEASLAVAEATVAKAKLAYTMEPLATDALFVVGLASDEAGLAILSAARMNSKRNQLVGLSLLELAAKRNDTETVLSLVDELTRVRPQLAPQFVSILSSSLTDERSLPLLEQALAANPGWAVSFWRRVPEDSAALTRFVQLREKISPPADLEAERRLLQALVKSERFADAFELFDKSPYRGEPDSTRPPLDWQLTQTRDVRARQTSANALDLFIQRDTSGKIAEKLVRVTAGEWVLSSQIESRQGQAKVKAALRCASQRSDESWKPQVVYPSARWSIPEGSCQYAWLTLSGSAWDSPLSFEGSLRNLKFEKR